jgi:hypothetical protein
MLVLTKTLNSFKSKVIIDRAMLAFKFQLKFLSTNIMILHNWLHQGEHLSMVYVIVESDVNWNS